MHALFSLSLFRTFLPKTFCLRILWASATLLMILVKDPPKILDHFQSPGGFFLSILFILIVLNARFSVADRVSTMELYVAF